MNGFSWQITGDEIKVSGHFIIQYPGQKFLISLDWSLHKDKRPMFKHKKIINDAKTPHNYLVDLVHGA